VPAEAREPAPETTAADPSPSGQPVPSVR
jgi:hypothetical protein